MNDWSGRRVAVLGAARQGIALARYLVEHGAQVILNDRRPEAELQTARAALADLESRADTPLRWICGGHPLEVLQGIDLLCVSGGVPLSLPVVVEAQRQGIPLSNDSQIFLEAVPCKVIGITGSAGKTTTTTLVGRMAQAALAAEKTAGRVWVGGNIGVPLIAKLDEMSAQDLAVMELSSFQLELMTRSPQVAAMLNITPNHLDRHGSMAAYTAAKARILAYQSGEDTAILGRDDLGAWSLRGKVKGNLVTFGLSEMSLSSQGPGMPQADVFSRNGELFFRQGEQLTRLMSRSVVKLRGDHNLLNVLAACAISLAAGLPVQALESGVRGFGGVAHRLEFVRSWGGANWYNDSIATAPERTIAAIHSFTEPLVLLLGGRDKDLPWEDLAALVMQRVDHLIVFGEAADKIIQAMDSVQPVTGEMAQTPPVTRCTSLRQAVQAASQVVRPGAVVLLSPGGTSFDEFVDFEERGECFRQLVMQL